MRDPYATAAAELQQLAERILELRDGEALARAHVQMEQRVSLIEEAVMRLDNDLREMPEKAATAMLSALKAANLLREPSEGEGTLSG